MGIEERYRAVRDEVAEEARACGRRPEEVQLIAVSKTVGLEGVQEAIDGGCTVFGENRPDQIMEKFAAFPQVEWHFIGNIQSRRIKDIVPCATMIHSLNHEEHADKISRVAEGLGKVQDVLVEVNVSGEESKSGVAPEAAPEFVAHCCALDGLRVRGLMTMAPQGDKAVADATFRGLAQLAAEIRATLAPPDALVFDQLSMGMSEDWPWAIAEGSTMVRIGRAIFSDNFNE